MAKTGNDLLFRLVHSLDAGERRFFLRFTSGLPGGASSSRKFFKAILKQESYDEKALKKSETYLSGFAQQKKFLFELILRSLCTCHARSTSWMIIAQYLEEAEMLRRKRLFLPAIRIAEKALKLAEETDNHLAVIQITALLDDLHFDARDKQEENEYSKSITREKTALEKITEEQQYRQLTKKIFHLQLHQHNFAKSGDRKFMKKILSGQHQPSSARARWYFNNSRTAGFLGLGNISGALQSARENVLLLEHQPHRLHDAPNEYVKALSSLLVVCDLAGEIDQSEEVIFKLRQQVKLHPRKLSAYEVHIFIYTFTTEFNNCMRREDYDRGLMLIPEIENGLKRYEKKIHADEALVFHQNFATLYIQTKQYRKAFRKARFTLDQFSEQRRDMIFNLRIILLFCGWLIHERAFFLKLMKKEIPLIDEMEIAPEFTQSFFEFLENVSAAAGKKQRNLIIRNYMDEIRHRKWNQQSKQALDGLDLPNWLKNELA